jgi:hypothetical protein
VGRRHRSSLVSGACPRGADRISEDIWASWGGQIERHPADWDRYGRSACFRRNADMVTAGADVCLAFILAASVGIPVRRYACTDTTRHRQRYPARKARQSAPDLAGLPLASGFTNLVASKRDGEIELDPHVDGGCLILLGEAGATVLLRRGERRDLPP